MKILQLATLVSIGLPLLSSAALAYTTPTSWDVASEFSEQSNPNGTVWEYGETVGLNGVYTRLTTPDNTDAGNIQGWQDMTSGANIWHNMNEVDFINSVNIKVAPHGMSMHPAQNCQYAVTRFTAPVSGTYKISGQFFGLDDNGSQTDTDVHVSASGSTVFSGAIKLSAGQKSASFTSINATLSAGNTVDFSVGCGSDGAWSYDNTGLNAVIELKKKSKKGR